MNIRRALITLGLVTGLSLSFSGIVLADPYDCSNGPNPVPANVSGDAEVSPDPGTEGDDCVLNNLTVSGTLTITAPGTITAQSLTSGSGDLTVSGGTISIAGAVNANGGEAWIATGSGPTSVQKVTAASNIRISGGGVTAGGNPVSGGLTANGGGVFVTSGNTTHITAPVNATQNINISGQQALTVDKVVTSTGGTVNLQSNSSSATVSEKVTGYSYVVVTARTTVDVVDTESTNNYVWIRSTNGDIASMDEVNAYDRITIQALTDVNIVGDLKSANNYVSISGRNITSDHLIDAGSSIYVQANSTGAINIDGTLTSHTPSLSAFNVSDVTLSAGKSIVTGSITTGSFNIYAYQGGTSPTTFTVGTAGANGVNGSITANHNHGNGSSNITNGLSSSTGGNITISSASALNYTHSSTLQRSLTLNAYGGTLSLPLNLTLSLDGAAGQKAGFLTLNARRIDALDNVTLTASQDDTAAGSAHYVAIATDQLNYGNSFTIKADGHGANTTSRSQVVINPYPYSPTNTLAISGTPGSHLEVSANGENAAVTISGDTLSFAGGTASIESKGFLNHTITLKGRSVAASNLTISNTGDFVLDASGVVADDEGGTVTITAQNFNPSANTKIYADGVGTGKGGNITIANSVQTDIASLASDAILARGGDDGEGGVVVVEKVAEFLVNTKIKVSSGSNVTSTSAFAGSISLNGETCQQWLRGTVNFPRSYWNCVNPDSPVPGDDYPVTVIENLSASIKSDLAGVGTHIYYQVDTAQFGKFFGHAIGPSAGFTFPEGPAGLGAPVPDIVDLTVFQNADLPATGYTTLGAVASKETTIHEVGHAIDAAHGFESAGYDAKLTADLNHLDAAGLPCAAVSGPFQGIEDFATAAQFCTGTTLTNPAYAGLSNSDIAAASQAVLGPGVWSLSAEIYAQTFAYEVYSNTLGYPSGYFLTTADGLIHNGYYQCIRAVVAPRAGTAFGPTSYTCP